MPEFNTVFVNFDFGPSHTLINNALNGDDVETAKTESEKVLKAQEGIKQSTKAIGGTIVFENGTNLIINVPFDEELIESMADIYVETTGKLTNIGIGQTVIESHSSVAGIRGASRGHIILGSVIKEDLVANRLFYKQAKNEHYDLRIAEIIKLALSELSIITTEEKVYDIFLRLIKENVLNSVDDIRTYFFQPVEELKEGIRTIYKRQATGCLLYAMPVPMAPGQTVINQNPKQKSPHKRHNWWSIEEYNQDAVDYRKTDLQYVPGNVTRDSQNMSMGGEPGEAIATT